MAQTPGWRDLVTAVQAWTKSQVPPHPSRPAKSSAGRLFVVNDALWGSVRISALERALIDTPLMQRLRRIRQLGPATLVYPSAGHTRFEHSLGALHRATTVMDTLVTSATGERPEKGLLAPKDDLIRWTAAVRLGALLHDVGHTFSSHAGERCVTAHGFPGLNIDIDECLAVATQDLDCEKSPSLSELLSFAILSSDAIKDLCLAHQFPEDQLRILSGAILRSRSHVAPEFRWVADLLSGPLDVDKQDYVPRDAMMAGVGVQVEPHRCAEVLRVCDLTTATVVNDSAAQMTPDERRVTITFAGISVLEDILLSRMSLFLRIYRHHKIRLAERLLEHAYELLLRTDLLRRHASADVAGIMDLVDSSFFEGEIRRWAIARRRDLREETARVSERQRGSAPEPEDWQMLQNQLVSLTQPQEVLDQLIEVLGLLERRNLPVRAFAYGKRFPDADLPFHRENASDSWNAICDVVHDRRSRKDLEEEIVCTALLLAEASGKPILTHEQVVLRAGTFVDLPQVPNIDVSPVLIYPRASDRTLLAYDKLFQPGQWLDALQDSKLICYVYAPRPFAHVVHTAAEVVFARKFGAMAHELRRAYSRSSLLALDELKEALLIKMEKAPIDIDGLAVVLRPPSYVSTRDKAASDRLARLVSTSDRLVSNNQNLTSKFLRTYESVAIQIAMSVDIVGSSAYAARLSAKNISEGEVRATLLDALLDHTFLNFNAPDIGVLPLKTEGDAVVAVGVCKATTVGSFIAQAAECVYGDGWAHRLLAVQKQAGWPQDALGLRISVARGDVQWRPELRDVLGTSVTQLFLTEASVKELMKTSSARMALLGEWETGDVPGVEISSSSEVTHAKTGSVTVRTVTSKAQTRV